MFQWIRQRVREAFIAGVQDAVDDLTTPKDSVDLPAPRLLRLPAPDDDDQTIPAKKMRRQG